MTRAHVAAVTLAMLLLVLILTPGQPPHRLLISHMGKSPGTHYTKAP